MGGRYVGMGISGGDVQVRRWRRYGKDRLYVADASGEQLGWVDLASGTVTVNKPEATVVVQESMKTFCTEHGLPNLLLAAADASAATPDPSSPGPPRKPVDPVSAQAASDSSLTAELSDQRSLAASAGVAKLASAEAPPAATAVGPVKIEEPGWVDLADNVPGQAARAQAETELAAMRERSRVGSFLARAFDVKTDERAWRVGSGGEETVGAKLDKLEKYRWHVLHAVPVGTGDTDIDHVVIGHGGVYTVNTKTHPGGRIWVGKHQVRVNGFATDYLRKSRAEAARTAKLLTAAVGFEVVVRPTLVFLTGSLIPNVTIKQPPEDVLVLNRMDIPGALRRAPRRLLPEQVAAIYEQARRSTTWKPVHPPSRHRPPRR